MKLLYIHQYFNFPENSGGTRSYDLAREFVSMGIDVTIITSSSNLKEFKFKKRWTYFKRDGIKFWVLKSNYSHFMSILERILFFFHFAFFATLKALAIESDIILATSTPLTVSIPAIIKKKISSTPFIFEVRDVWPEGPIQQGYIKNRFLIIFLRKIEKYIYKQSAYVVPLSIGMKKDILSRVSLNNIKVITNISEIDRFKNISNKVELKYDFTDRKIILYAGTLGPVNDIMYLAKLAEKMIHIESKIAFLVVGDGKQKKEIIAYCKKHNILNKNIYFLDPVSKNSLPYLYNIATMGSSFVWDYKIKWDNSANKFFDTLAAGRPILINYQGWQADVIQNKRCGYIMPYYFNEKDVVELAKYIMNDQIIVSHGKNALKAADEFSLKKAVEKYMEIFNELKNIVNAKA